MSVQKKRKIIQSEGRAIIAKVYKFLKEEYNFLKDNNPDFCDLSPLTNIRQRTANATGVSERTVTAILKEEKELPSPNAKFPTPLQNRKKRKSKFDFDESSVTTIRNTIAEYQLRHEEFPSLAKLKAMLKDKIGFDGCLNTLRVLLIKLGYTWKKQKINKKAKEPTGIEEMLNL